MKDLMDIHEILERPIELVIRQQPVHSRMCGIGERVDRRPIDPPPVVQLKINTLNGEGLFALSSYLFLVAVLIPVNSDNEIHSNRNHDEEDENSLDILLHGKLTVGRTVSSLYILKDLDDSEGGFFVFSDISVRAEGTYRLRMCLFDIMDGTVRYNTSILTDPFVVYSAKTFPGMYKSCPLVQSFARQGLKIRIRRESGPRPARYSPTSSSKKKTVRSIKSNTAETSSPSSPTTSSIMETTTPLTINTSDQTQFIDIPPWHMPVSPPKRRRLSLSYLLDSTDSENNSMDTSL
ncbi:hypothetical protein K501DRAFT_207680 [Backusella circina FSU 941]|nr:hypothetical protein K501DRAFT_207680 [Backusella circina FSU 941]